MKLELLTNATVVDDAIRFVAEKQGQGLGLDMPKSKNGSSAPYESSEEERGSISNQVY